MKVLIITSYLQDLNYKEVIHNGNELLSWDHDIEVKASVFELLAKANAGAKFYDKALKCKDSLILIKNEVNKIKNIGLFESTKVKFDIVRYKNQIVNHSK